MSGREKRSPPENKIKTGKEGGRSVELAERVGSGDKEKPLLMALT